MNDAASGIPPVPDSAPASHTTGNPYAAPSAPDLGLPVARDQDDRNLAVLAHLTGIFSWFLGPLLIWLTQKDKSPYVAREAKEALNWQITVVAGFIASAILMVVLIGMITMPLVMLANLVFSILGVVKAMKGESYTYPFALRLLK